MSIETRVRALEKHLAQDARGESWQERVDRFSQLAAQGIRFEDLQAIAAGQWGNVTSPMLLASRHRDRWEHAAPALLVALTQGVNDDDAKNAC